MEQFYQDHNNIERLAREKYKMKQSDEDVFIVE